MAEMEKYLSADLMTPKWQLVKAEPGLRHELLLDSQQLKLICAVYDSLRRRMMMQQRQQLI